MKKKSVFRIISAIVLLFLSAQFAFSQKNSDAYQAETDGYFIHPVSTTEGIVMSDNFASAIYLIKDNDLKVLASTPGCGRYFTVSNDRSEIGYKLIGNDGMQVPAIFNLKTNSIVKLSEPVKLCGQPSFSSSGKIVFTIGNELNVVNGSEVKEIDLGVYSNITPVSPDGNKVIYNDNNDQLFIIDLLSGKTEQFTDNKCGYVYPQWSPDGNKVSFSTLSGNILIWDRTSNNIFPIGPGENVAWSDDSKFIIYSRSIAEDLVYKGSDIYFATVDGSKIVNVTNTPDVNEISPSIGEGNSILYSAFGNKEIASVALNLPDLSISENKSVYKNTSLSVFNSNSLDPENIKRSNPLSITMVEGDVPYVHQVYDTPTWHSGYSSCAPTTAIMALAYYNRLPKWPTVVDHGKSWDPHSNDYGSYVADRYRYNGIYYSTTANDYAGNTSYGGYGYMWGLGSPNSYMATYLQNHNVTSVHSTSTTFANVQTEINNSYPFPICNTLSTAGHLTLAIGYVNNQHTLIFNDPYGDKNTGTWPNYTGQGAYYDWPGYSNGYQNLNTVAWTVTAEASQISYNDTIVDDVNYNHGFYMYNQSPSHMRYFHDGETGGYGNFNHYWYTTTSTSTTIDTCYVTWTPTIPTSGNYQVFAYIPASIATATTARYHVYYNGGNQTVVINQATHLGQWVSLGTFSFLQGSAGYVRLGDGSGIASQQIAFDAMKWDNTSPSTPDVVPPSTAIAVTGTWQTQNFSANFTDTDNLGGSGVEKGFYTVADYNGSEWHGNATRGFISDNFISMDTAWKVPASGGTWNISNGLLVQKDTTITNTNIYTYLNQNLSNRYIYHFKAMMSSSVFGSSQRRFGIHFFCDTASKSNRNNSYFIFFRQETHRLEFYKVINDSYAQTKVDTNVVTNVGQWYDYKVIFDRITGKIDVYRDDVLLDSWTDPSPLTTSGNYISFRTGNSKVSFDSLEVFRSRYPSVTVNVGAAATNDIRYQDPNPSTPSGQVRSICNDSVGNISDIKSQNINIDWTAPLCTTVKDGTGTDADTMVSPTPYTALSANWIASTDANSGISKYWYSIGTTVGGTDLVNWTDNGTNTTVTTSSPVGYWNQLYYFTVKTVNGAGLADTCFSDGIIILPTVGINEVPGVSGISVQPNPFSENTVLNFFLEKEQKINISLVDILGKTTLVSEKIYNAGENKISINADELQLSKGMYLLKIKIQEKIIPVSLIRY